MQPSWDIFCRVIDNYGDIGVTWRLARQLAAEQGASVRLWVDELEALVPICPHTDRQAACQQLAGVEVRRWNQQVPDVLPADVVIEAFGCELPASFIDAMAARSPKPLWLNLEYLSAEDWVGGCHGLPSPQSGGLQKFFFFPGFDGATGGLLRERELLARRQAFQREPGARERFLQTLGVELTGDTRLISLFAYENPALPDWLEQLARGPRTRLLVPEGRILGDLQRWLGVERLAAGDCHPRGALEVQVLPFLAQDDYDRLLWSCDLNAVRGEDSFVRAQWAGRPLLWHIYKQEEDAHLEKLEAFLVRYSEGLSAPAASALSGFWGAWNRGEPPAASWAQVETHWPELRRHAERWCAELAAQADLASALAKFYQSWLSCAA
jgi:uncharacterized repeat protein (TIGR03837 family)